MGAVVKKDKAQDVSLEYAPGSVRALLVEQEDIIREITSALSQLAMNLRPVSALGEVEVDLSEPPVDHQVGGVLVTNNTNLNAIHAHVNFLREKLRV